ncbi:asparaginase [Halomonas sp. BC1]|uniref:asparaginase n=1 Tax=Halomonas sp. BC1 TaxID=1670448 RepID=UPI0009BFA250|nr:asparaginase [Halomonas sp. BC1]
MPRQPILVIYTGGTLGMRMGPHGLAPEGDFGTRLRQAIARLPIARQDRLPGFALVETPEPIDSSSASPTHWQMLARRIVDEYGNHSGIVVLHGTDTLAWTASSLAYQLQGIDIPVVVTGAMQPLEAPGSDALGNIETALRFAALPELQEVALCFAGKLMRGVRARKWHALDGDAFVSPNYPLLGELQEQHVVLHADRGLGVQQRGAPRFETPDYDASAVVRLALWPGIAAWQVAAWLDDRRIQGALLEVWGAGNAPSDPQLLGVLARAVGEGKLLAAVSQCPHGRIHMGGYAAGQGLASAGVLSADDMTPEAAFTKLVHLLGLPLEDRERRRRFMTPLVGER